MAARSVTPLSARFERQFEHADQGIHRRADFMAHGRQERGLGAVGIVGGVLGLLQLAKQLLALADLPALPGDPRPGQASSKAPAGANAWKIVCR